jgi:hypothetical protein
METMEAEEEEPQGQSAVMNVAGQPKRKRTKRTAEPLDVKSLRHSTRLNKGEDGFKAQGITTDTEANPYVGRLDREAASGLPPHLSKANVQAIGTGFLKMQPMVVSDAALFASSGDDKE